MQSIITLFTEGHRWITTRYFSVPRNSRWLYYLIINPKYEQVLQIGSSHDYIKLKCFNVHFFVYVLIDMCFSSYSLLFSRPYNIVRNI